MAQELLNRSDVLAVLEPVGGERVTERVRGGPLGDPEAADGLMEAAETPDRTEREASGLWAVLDLAEGSAVLDAPSGYGRIACELAQRAAEALGVDLAADLLSEAARGATAPRPTTSRFSTLRAAVRPRGLVFGETKHRDGVVVGLSRTPRLANRLPDGTPLIEEPRLEPVTGRVEQ